jgi:MmgE/PrpD N-terminal domain
MSLLRSMSDGLRRPPALSDAEQQLQRLHVLDTDDGRLGRRSRAGGCRPSKDDRLCGLDWRRSGPELGGYAIVRDRRYPSVVLCHANFCCGPSALTLAEQMPEVSLERVAVAIGAATDLMVRLGVVIDGAHLLYLGGWPTSLAAPLGATATAAGLFGPDGQATAHALALALSASTAAIGQPPEPRTGRWVLLLDGDRPEIQGSQTFHNIRVRQHRSKSSQSPPERGDQRRNPECIPCLDLIFTVSQLRWPSRSWACFRGSHLRKMW